MKYMTLKKLMLLGSLSVFTGVVAAQNITGAGASFPAPVYAKWASEYNKETGKKVNYQSMGSSAGINQIKAGTVDFGASDAPLSDKELAADGLVQFPTVIGGIVPVVNIQGIKAGDIKLSGEVLAEIFLGNIKEWNDPQVQKLNPDLKLPAEKINVVQRADGSGSSFVFTTYLTKVSPNWAAKVGAGKSVKWPVGAGGKGNEGVAAYVSKLKNSIGYVEYAYTKQNNLSYVLLQNSKGEFIAPNEESFKASTVGIEWEKSFNQDITDPSGAGAWPISTATYIIMHKVHKNPAKSEAALKFFDWALTNGDQLALDLDYVTFPDSVKKIIRNSWTKVTDDHGHVIKYK